VIETWDLWFPSMGATGGSYARSRVESEVAGDRVLVHAAPPKLDVVVRDEGERVVAAGYGLERHQPGPMSFLIRSAAEVRLEDGWPSQGDLGRLVILPGGEAGILTAWWHADDRREWRWQVEFSNHV
jgi:hypothetical protein